MPRKSRKDSETLPVQPNVRTMAYNVGAYVRLSAVDRKNKGDSIENQQAIINAYIAGNPELVLAEIYIDNGTS